MGTNNHGHTAEQVSGGIQAIVQLVNQRQPQARVVVLVSGQMRKKGSGLGPLTWSHGWHGSWHLSTEQQLLRQTLMWELATPIEVAVAEDVFRGPLAPLPRDWPEILEGQKAT